MLRFLRNRNHVVLTLPACLVILVVGACTKPPPPSSNPIGNQAAALGIHVKTRALPRFLSIEPEIVVFARVEEGVALTETYELYGSTYAHDGHAYIMNAEPGTYVAVASFNTASSDQGVGIASGEKQGKTKTTDRCYFSRDLIEQTRVTVKPGEFVFMGRIVGDRSRTFGEGDDCQRHFMTLIEQDRSGFAKVLSGDSSRRLDLHEIDTSPAAHREFLTKTREYFVKTAWVALIDAELEQLP